MRRLFLSLALLLAPLAAEASTTTCQVVFQSQPFPCATQCRVIYEFRSYRFPVEEPFTDNRSEPPGTDGNLRCLEPEMITRADQWFLQRDRNRVLASIIGSATPELVPVYHPEVCPDSYPNPANGGGTAVENCRKARAHQSIIRSFWGEATLPLFNAYYEIHDWLGKNAQQGGAAFNTNQQQQWIAVGSSIWTQKVNPAMNNMNAISSGLALDRQNRLNGSWGGDLD